MRRQDVIVVGAGVAGLTAAVRLAEAGVRVLVLAKGVGSTHLAPGTIDVSREPLADLVAAHPQHPYAVIGTDGLAAAAAWFGERVATGPLAPYAYVGGVEENFVLPSAVGAAKPSALVPVTMAGGDLRAGGDMRIVGFRTLKDFHPALAADNLTAGGAVRAQSAELDLGAPGRADVNSLALARRFDDPAFRRDVAAQLVGRLAAGERVGFPAVLGVRDPHGAWSELEHALGRRVFEIPTLPPSVPGMRLFATLRAALQRARGQVLLNNVVVGPVLEGERLTGVRVRVGLRDATYLAAHVVLATGGFASGGIELDSRWRAHERALGLPVAGVPAPGEPRFSERYFDEHPMARAGVAVDSALRPLAEGGEPVYANVRVVGGSLAGAAPWREGCGDGLSLLSGYRAAELILSESRAGGVAPPTGSRQAVAAPSARGAEAS
jgi:glycerol-3-phosphate dehydrogenase subunit B